MPHRDIEPVGDAGLFTRPAINESQVRPRRSLSIPAVIGVSVLISAILLFSAPDDYPQLHVVLDSATCFLSAVLAIMLWDTGSRSGRGLYAAVALAFGATWFLELLHVAVTAEWAAVLTPLANVGFQLRPIAWRPAAYILPIGLFCALAAPRSQARQALWLALFLVASSAVLLWVFYRLPLYAPPGLLGITRPTLIGAPVLWAWLATVFWRGRVERPLHRPLALMALILAVSHLVMLYSRTPHDALGMAAHIGRACAYVTLLLWLVQAAAQTTREHIRVERELADANTNLERRVVERTTQLAHAIDTLNAEIRAHKQSEQELALSHAHSRAIFDAALDGIITMDHKGRITQFNPAAGIIFGHDPAAVIGRPLDEVIIPQSLRLRHQQGLTRYLESGSGTMLGKRMEMPGLGPGGTQISLEFSVARLPGSGPPRFAGFVRDVSAHRAAAQALEASQARFETLIESVPEQVWTCRTDGWCEYVNRQWVEYTGRPESAQLGYGWTQFLHPDDSERMKGEFARATERGERFDSELRIRGADGQYHWFRTRAIAIRDDTGRIVKWLGSNTDVEEYKQGAQSLRTQVERLALLDQITRAIAVRQDPTSILEIVIKSVEESLPIDFGCIYLRDGTSGALALSCLGPKSEALRNRLATPGAKALADDPHDLSRCLRGEFVYVEDASGAPLSFSQQFADAGMRSIVAAPLTVNDTVFGVLIAARNPPHAFPSSDCEFLRQLSNHVALCLHQSELNCTLQKAYDELRQTQERVSQQERLRALGQMASGIAHDINSALSPAALCVQSMLEHDPAMSAQTREYLTMIERSIHSCTTTVSQIKEFSRQARPYAGSARVDLNAVVTDVLQSTRARWSAMSKQSGADIRASSHLAPALPPILGVEGELRDALTNLVLNSVDAMPDGGTLTLTTSINESGRVCVDVLDTGAGMDETTKARCLEPFFSTKGERGTGLGLAMVFSTVQRHRGELEVKSSPGAGTTMRLTFAVAEGKPVETRSFERGPARPLRVLLIDDDAIVLKSLRIALELEGHRVITADNGRLGLDLFAAAERNGSPFSVVVTDLEMLHMDGRAVAAGVKSLRADATVILLTGWGHQLLTDDELPAHIDYVLGKPPKLEQLRHVLAAVTSARAA